MKWIVLLLGIATNASASVLIKMAMIAPRRFPSLSDPVAAMQNWPFWLGLGLYGLAFLLYAAALTLLPLNVAHPVLTSGAVAAVALLSILIFNEQFYWTTGVGILLVIAGVVLITARAAVKIMTSIVNTNSRELWNVPEFDISFFIGGKTKFCVIIPVINEGSRIITQLVTMQEQGIGKQIDIIIVDGGSTDGSLELNRLKALDVKGLIVKSGSGKLSAQLRCGYAFALEQDYQGIVTIDGNNKDDPDAIPSFIHALQSGIDFVQASRYLPGGIAENTPKVRDLAIRCLHAPLLSFFSGFKWTDTTQGFRAYSRELLMDPRIAPFRDVFDSYELLAYLSYRVPRLGYRCQELPTTRRYPVGEVPTKISSFRGNFDVFKVLLNACLGRYNPH